MAPTGTSGGGIDGETARAPAPDGDLLLAITSCDPYQRFGQGDDSYGPSIRSTSRPPTWAPAAIARAPARAASPPRAAFVAGQRGRLLRYPLPPPATPMSDPLAVAGLGAPPAFAFEQKCQAPTNYAWDPAHMQTDEVRLDQQGAVFTALPRATYVAGMTATSTYAPVVQRVPVSAPDQPCQKLKSAEAIQKVGLNAMPDGHLLAWLIIDPAAPVFPVGKTAANHPASACRAGAGTTATSSPTSTAASSPSATRPSWTPWG
jgi:hypothetical protein